jgi:ketopantoate reductase
MVGGTTYVVTTIVRPGVIRHTGTNARIRCGRPDGQPDDALASYVEQIKAADVPADFPTDLDTLVAGFAPMMKASMANDLDAGNRLELDWLAGKVVALGRKYGLPTPAQEVVYAILKPYRMGRIC